MISFRNKLMMWRAEQTSNIYKDVLIRNVARYVFKGTTKEMNHNKKVAIYTSIYVIFWNFKR